MSSKYFDTESSIQVIGCIYSNPDLLNNDKYTFTEDDFVPELHKVIFSAMNNLFFTGGNEKFSRQTVEDYIGKFPESLAIYKAQNGREWLDNAYHSANVTNFNFYASRVKKMTLLREYERVGMDVSYILDPDEVDPRIRQEKEEIFNGLSMKELADNVENKVLRVKDDVVEDNDNLEWHAGDDSEQILDDIMSGKNLGYPFYDPVYTAITGGARRGKMILRSAASGVGKAIPNDTIIPTPSGDKRVDEVKVGDYLFDGFAKPTKVLGIFYQGKKDVWRVTFDDGRQAKCSPDHLWSYITYDDLKIDNHTRKFRTSTLRDMSYIFSKEIPQHYSDDGKKNVGSYCVPNLYVPIVSFEPDTNYGRFNQIIKIEDLGYQTEMTCFLVDNPEHLFLMNDFIVTHNTRTSVADACYLACDEIYENGQWQNIGERIPTLFISVEVDEAELESLLLSFIADVPSNHIMENNFDVGEYDRVVHAIDVEKRSKLHAVFMPDYKLKDVRNAIVKGIREYGTQVIFFDYICSSTSIMAELASSTGGVKLNEFQVLYNMASSLKDIAENFGVTIVTSSQLNRSAMDTLTPTANVLAGASSMANRVDTAMAMRDVTREDLKEIGDYFDEGCEPNVVGGVFKNRSGKWNNIILYYAADKGTCRYRVIFATDYLMRPISLEKILPEDKQEDVF